MNRRLQVQSRSERPSLRHTLVELRTTLRVGGVAEWKTEAEVLLRHALKLDRADFLTTLYTGDEHLTQLQADCLQSLIHRRLSSDPLAYIVGRREFYGLEIEVNEHVLIPRQETETLVDTALEFLGATNNHSPTVVDVGTGSGAVALAIAANYPGSKVTATDVSGLALDVARRNSDRLQLADRVCLVRGDLLKPISGSVDVIVSNPPYIPNAQIARLQPEVQREPSVALDGGDDGLDVFRRLLSQANQNGLSWRVIVVELMPEQMDAARAIVDATLPGLAEVDVRSDLAGDPRALVLQRR